MIGRIDSFLKSADQYCDYVPFISTVSSTVDLFQKCVVIPFLKPETIQGSHYYKHIYHKNYSKCLFLLIPILGQIALHFFTKNNTSYPDKMFTLFQENYLSINSLPKLDLKEIKIEGDINTWITPEMMSDSMMQFEHGKRFGIAFSLEGYAEGKIAINKSQEINIKEISGVLAVVGPYFNTRKWVIRMSGILNSTMNNLHVDKHDRENPIHSKLACLDCPHGMTSGAEVNYKVLSDLLENKDPFFRINLPQKKAE